MRETAASHENRDAFRAEINNKLSRDQLELFRGALESLELDKAWTVLNIAIRGAAEKCGLLAALPHHAELDSERTIALRDRRAHLRQQALLALQRHGLDERLFAFWRASLL